MPHTLAGTPIGGGEFIRGLVTLGPVVQLAEEALGSSKVRPRGLKELDLLLLGGLLASGAVWWGGGGEQIRLNGDGEGDWTRELGSEEENGLATLL